MSQSPRPKRVDLMTMRRVLEVDASRSIFPSGSDTLDELLGGGFKTGEMVEIFGASNTGKTQLGIQAAISVATRGFACAFVDTEGQFRPERLSSICLGRNIDPDVVLPMVYSVRAESTRRQIGAISTLRKEKKLDNCKMIVVDTLTKNFSLEYGGIRMAGKRQTVLSAYLSRLARDAYLHDRAVVLLNRVASIGTEGFDREVDIGGETVRHFSQKVVYLRRSGPYVMASRPDLKGAEVRTSMTDSGLE
jgi:DNA repair protein RAD51